MSISATPNEKEELGKEQIAELVEQALEEHGSPKRVLVIHNDYSRNDFTHQIVPALYASLAARGLEKIDFLNAGGTHRAMSQEELVSKLGVSADKHPLVGEMFNHEFDNAEQIAHVVDLPASFVAEKTAGHLEQPLSVTINKLVFEDYDLVIAINGTVPHEALGYSGGTKMFFPGISGPEVIAMLHWAAVLMGIPEIIGKADNPARDVVNEGTRHIFEKMGKTPVLSLNMVYTEDSSHRAVPRGLFAGTGFEGFRSAHASAAELSSRLHIIYLDQPKRIIVQQLPEMYDEVWTAGKGSYKLQRPGVLAEGAEIVLLAPHIDCFHSNARMDKDMREIGYHGLEYVLDYCKKNPSFDKNVASHVINVRGHGEMRDGKEYFPFSVTLATKISEADCHAVGLGYRDPKTVTKDAFTADDVMWIDEGGQWLYASK